MANIIVQITGEVYSTKNPGVPYVLYDAVSDREELYVKDGSVTILINGKTPKEFTAGSFIVMKDECGRIRKISPS